jgi:glycogen debranching enzyme
MHADGALATGPIALCEVQAYVFAAKRGGAMLARLLGLESRAVALTAAAEALRRKFEEQFWCEDIGTYAMALDGDKRPCKVRSSNAGQVLFCGIASPERAERVADCLMSRDMFTGWGVRTLSSEAPRFNPMSYHNGSVWPHDNALIALGLAQYGCKRAVSALFEGLFDAANHMEMMRIPELFCGFARRRGGAPTLYPVACAPQAWASVVPFALLKAALGLKVEYGRKEILFHDPRLPAFMEEVTINGLVLGEACVDLRLTRRGEQTEAAIVGRKGHVAIRITQ